VSRKHIDNRACMHGRKASSGSADQDASKPSKRQALGGKFSQSTRKQSQKAKDLPGPEDAPQTTVLRGRERGGVDRASGIALDAGTVVRVMSQHAIDERKSEWLDTIVLLDGRSFVFCALHAHMRLTEALVKDMFGRAIESRRVPKLKEAFKTHLGLENKFVRSEKTKGWNKVSLYGYECWRFAEQDENGVSKIEKVVRDVWHHGAGIMKGPSADSGLCDGEFADAYCALWRLFNTGMRQTRCKDLSSEDLAEYGANCRDLGARWNLLLPSNRCSTFYLHTQ
jgi:hypothetical protein